MIQLTGQVVPVKLNAEKAEGLAIARKYRVTGFPTILFINEKGAVEDVIGGYMPPAGFSQKIQEALTVHSLPTLEARCREHPNDLAILAKLVPVYAAKGDIAKAEAALAQEEKADPQNREGHLSKSESAVGDYYQMKNQFGQAVPRFEKAVKVGKDPYDLAYAHISLATCYMSQHKRAEALNEYKATAAVPNCPPELKSQAEQAVAALSQAKGPR